MSGPEGLSVKTGNAVATVTVHRTDQPGYNTPDLVFNTGPVTATDLFFVWAAGLLGAGPTWSTNVKVYRRTKTAGVWTSLAEIHSDTRSAGSPKRGFGFAELLSGVYDDVEYSMVARIGGGSSIPASSSSVASDFAFTSQVS